MEFVEEIDYHELRFIQVVGRGAFGVVSQGKWRGTDVAVKHIETESEKRAFITELKQLSRVNHPNIVMLYGACTQSPVCLVMEYAEGGSVYNVLHGIEPQPDYTIGHAMSWCLQCAKGVEYLHGMKPRPLIHRDLKPPNLLLVAGGTKLKICDFGTACDAHTHMTNNKGSAAWMAPEVFEGSKYSEKCDVFSWGIIFWEVLTRRKPFDEMGGPAFRIMWAVHNGTRPPLISNCPKPIQKLMTRCWAANPVERPSMMEVVRIMTVLIKYCPGGDEPLVYPPPVEPKGVGSVYDTPPQTNPSPSASQSGTIHALRDTVHQALSGTTDMGELVPIQQPATNKRPVEVEEEAINWRRTSAPASLAASRENLLDKSSRSSTPSVDLFKRYSADFSKWDQTDLLTQGAQLGSAHVANKPAGRGHKRTGSYGNSPFVKPADTTPPPITESATDPADLNKTTGLTGRNYRGTNSVSWSPSSSNVITTPSRQEFTHMTREDMLNNMAHIPMDYHLEPLPPCATSPESVSVYDEHLKLAQDFYRLQIEIMVLKKRNEELQKELDMEQQEQLSNTQLVEEYTKLVSENESLTMLQNSVKKSIEQWKHEQQQQPTHTSTQQQRP